MSFDKTRIRTLIDFARRHQKPGSGSANFTPPASYRMHWPNLTQALTGIPFAVAGGVATRRYMPERATGDLDILVRSANAAAARAALVRAGFVREGELSIGGSQWRTPEGVAVDVIEGSEPWCGTALEQAVANVDFDGNPVLTLPYLVLMKLLSGRMQDGADISRMLGNADEASLSAVKDVVARHAPNWLEDVESMAVQGRLDRNGD